MSTDPDDKREPTAPAEPEAEGTGALASAAGGGSSAIVPGSAPLATTAAEDDDDLQGDVMPTYRRYVYAAYFAAALLVAFLADRFLDFGWGRLAAWKPELGEPREELTMPIGAAIGAVVALYYWRNASTRELADSVAQELSKVTWPTKNEVMNNTIVVLVTTAFATVFFALMDRFWGFVTNLVYGT